MNVIISEAWQVNVHELIVAELVHGPACCLCCQGQAVEAKKHVFSKESL